MAPALAGARGGRPYHARRRALHRRCRSQPIQTLDFSRLVDVAGYLGILLHGLAIATQSVAVGGTVFLIAAARPFAGLTAAPLAALTARIAAWAAAGLIAVELVSVWLQGAVLRDTVGLSWVSVLTAGFAEAGLAKALAAAALLVLLGRMARARYLLLACAAILATATLTTHAAARLTGVVPLLATEFLHLTGGALWIGGIPAFVAVLARVTEAPALAAIGARFSRLSMIGVGCIAASGAVMVATYIGSLEAGYGTAYGVMVGAKITLFVLLLGLGAGNLLVTGALARGRPAPVLRMRRFAEVEIGIGLTVFFTAASLTSVPPAADLTQDRASWHEIVERDLTPRFPRLVSPDHDSLAIPALQKQLDDEAAARRAAPRAAFVEGAGDLPPRNAADIAWSEYNHHWAGLFVLAIGLLALANAAGLRAARHWPLVFLGLAAFLFVRSDPEVWPEGQIGLLESLRDVEVVQHRAFVLLVVIFGLFEWAVRVGWLGGRWRYVFPLICALGGGLLLTHNHTIANVKDALLIEFTHTPLAIAAVTAGWARWLELRLPGRVGRAGGWVWPGCFVLIGVLLVFYREA